MKLQNQDIKIGKTIDELVEGETFSLSETIKNREILLYLGLTNDDNPLYS
ncbi:MAG: enoyl-CoA hydratase, partial [Pseudolactococcus laudensis]